MNDQNIKVQMIKVGTTYRFKEGPVWGEITGIKEKEEMITVRVAPSSEEVDFARYEIERWIREGSIVSDGVHYDSWGLFDGRSSSLNGHQLVMGVKGPQSFCVQDLTTGKHHPDYGLDGEIVAEVREDTPKFGVWTFNARLIVAALEMFRVLKAIAELMLMAERDQLKDWADFGARVYQHADTIRKIIARVEKGEE